MDNEFYPGMKVFLDGEYGVVLSDFWELNREYFEKVGVSYQGEPYKLYGVIRWDTDDERDVEDWRGVQGNFIQGGGVEIDSNHAFTFINDDGSLKK
ncbi:hypothetical protein QNI19_19650 [Cytophagaceae bacterium DM2B3-1]|uniref:Uncharacterized protein n=1 Tax=Xanthocytophaga flava TaxID=3048013 RepID=A0ABT7CN52_9BACT|nr:hypothetical protein [Xanthocytophaga flavus]MDJ1495164.1 hypothetical protein [Xanthocytophaga flavus]